MRIRGVDIHAQTQGSGPPFIWGHGLMGSVAQEDAAAMMPWSALPANVELIRYDARGHGASEASLDPDHYRWPQLALDAVALAEASGAERAVFGGVSMGAATTLHAAVLAPRDVRAMVLMAPPTAWETRARQARAYRTLARLVDSFGLGLLRHLGQIASFALRNRATASMQRSVMAGLRRRDPRAVATAMRGAAESDLPASESLRRLEMPTLVLAWAGDSSHPLSTARKLVELLPNAELSVARSTAEVLDWRDRVNEFVAALTPGG